MKSIEEAVAKWKGLVQAWADAYDLPLSLMLAVLWLEARGEPRAFNARSHATGLFQVISSDHPSPVFSARPTTRELSDPFTNVKWGCRIMAWFRGAEEGDLKGACFRYSGGTVWALRVPREEWGERSQREVAFREFEARYWEPLMCYQAQVEGILQEGVSDG